MAETVFSSGIFLNSILPFLLVFTLVFAIIEKTKIFGDTKKQINAIISASVALIFISFSYAVGITIRLMAFLAVFAIILFVFLLLWGFFYTGEKGIEIHRGVRISLGIIVAVAVIIAVLVFSGAWDIMIDALQSGAGQDIWINVIFAAIIIGAIAAVVSVKSGK
jgi:hypothetical protein